MCTWRCWRPWPETWSALEARIADLEARREQGKLPAGPVVPDICRAARAFAEENYRTCAEILEPVAAEVVRIGGSHAQREMIEDMLLIALMKSGEAAKAREPARSPPASPALVARRALANGGRGVTRRRAVSVDGAACQT